MSTYAYCYNCNESLGQPSLADAVLGEIECPRCDTSDAYTLDPLSQRLVLNEIADEIMNLRQEVDQSGPTLTLRDQFAMAALSGLVADGTINEWPTDEAAEASYQYADAMIKEREKADE